MGIYKRPAKKVHRGFFYLNDETVINSLSAVESGKIDEVVAKVNSAREGGFGAGIGVQGAKLEGAKKATSAFEEEMVRIRTRFSVFELWYQSLVEAKALGTFSGWGSDALEGVRPGDTVEFQAELEVVPLQTLLRLFIWFAEKAKTPGTPFSQRGDELKSTNEAARNMRAILGAAEEAEYTETVLLARPIGGDGPIVAMPITAQWLIGRLGRLGGQYSVVAQVDRVLDSGQEFPTLRLTNDVAATPLEVNTMREVVALFVQPAEALGVTISESDASISGPALWLEPIAIYR